MEEGDKLNFLSRLFFGISRRDGRAVECGGLENR